LLSLYLEGKTQIKVENLLTNDIAIRKYNIWQTNKKRVQRSFASQSSALRRSSNEKRAVRRTTLLSSQQKKMAKDKRGNMLLQP